MNATGPGATTLLEVRDLQVSLDIDDEQVPVIQGIDFVLEPGRVLALVGESGCGKSVTALAIMGLLPRGLEVEGGSAIFRPANGGDVVDTVRLGPRSPAIRRVRGAQIAMIFQEPMSSFSPVHTIGSQIGEVIRLHLGVNKARARDIAAEHLDRVGISEPRRAMDRYPHEYSGGMLQRAMIAKALSCGPSLLIADEPTTALDVTIQAQIIELLRALQRELAMGVLFITHDLGLVAQFANDVAIMYTGRIVEHGSVHDIFHRPKHPYTSSLIQAIPQPSDLDGRRRLDPIRGNVPSLYEMPRGCTFHPRCDAFIAGRCDDGPPPLTPVGEGHGVRCYLYD